VLARETNYREPLSAFLALSKLLDEPRQVESEDGKRQSFGATDERHAEHFFVRGWPS
jgi:hypothetical protein